MAENMRDFWNLDDFIPPKKEARRSVRRTEPEPVEIVSPPLPADHGQISSVTVEPPEKMHLHPPATARNGSETGKNGEEAEIPLRERPVNPFAPPEPPPEPPESIYRPEHSLLREVRIYPWRSAYTYYEQFRVYALKLNAREGEECPEIEFFSYMPQYTQLNRAQLRYYLWWRTNFRKGVCLHAAFSYLLLYLYEQINLSGKIPPEEGQQNILRLWLSYRKEHPRLDVLVREWLCDYSLLNRLPPPSLPRELFGELLAGCRLKEFYVSGWRDTTDEVVAILLFCNNYDYKKSKFYRAETAELYDRVLAGAVSETLQFLRTNEEQGISRTSGISTITRDAFSGSVCSFRVKRRIEVDFSSFSHTHELRYVMTDVLKYCENAIRGALSVKSRLTVYQVSAELRRVLDAYLAKALPQKATKRVEKETMPAYERRYEAPVTPISPEHAAQIEASSWQITKKLVEAFEPKTENIKKRTPLSGQMQMNVALSAESSTAPDAQTHTGATGEVFSEKTHNVTVVNAKSGCPDSAGCATAYGNVPDFGGSANAISVKQCHTVDGINQNADCPDFNGYSEPFTDKQSFGGGVDEVFCEKTRPSVGINAKTTRHDSAGSAERQSDVLMSGGAWTESLIENGAQEPERTLAGALGELTEFVRLAARGARAEQREFAAKRGEMIDAIADKINTVSGDILGDIILFDEGGYYTVIEDYLEDLRKAHILP